uniref:ORF2/2 n=2 Tax=Torque teno sus virus k2a TaxID=1968861 RepID=A0A385FPQ6_9VIRU|nr:ORF2/2 [Torque teno sus virus k2a]
MEERWLTVAYCAHGLFCDCKEPKKHLEKCLTDAIADAEGDRHGEGEGGSGDVTFDIGIDALIAAADIREIALTPGYKTPPRYTTQSLIPGSMTVTGLLEQILSKNSSKSPQKRRRRRERTRSLGRKAREGPYPTKTTRALSLLRAAVPATKRRKKRDTSTSSQASDDSSSTSSEW